MTLALSRHSSATFWQVSNTSPKDSFVLDSACQAVGSSEPCAFRRAGRCWGGLLRGRGAVFGGAETALDGVGPASVGPARVLIQQRLGRLAADDRVGDLVGVLLVGVADLADAALAVEVGSTAAALLHRVRGFVGAGVHVGRAVEGNVVAGRVRHRADPLGRLARRAAEVGDHAAHVVAAKRRLDTLLVRQRLARVRDARGGDGGHVGLGRGVGRLLHLQQRGAWPAAGRRGAFGAGCVRGGPRILVAAGLVQRLDRLGADDAVDRRGRGPAGSGPTAWANAGVSGAALVSRSAGARGRPRWCGGCG